MYTATISIPNISAARTFVAMTAKYPKTAMTLTSEEYSIDAHSIIGILSLDLSKPIELMASGDITDQLIKDIEPFTV